MNFGIDISQLVYKDTEVDNADVFKSLLLTGNKSFTEILIIHFFNVE